MAIGRITGSVLKSNLTRNGTDLAFETNLLYLDVTNSRVGIGTSEPTTALQVNGTITATAMAVTGSTATINSKEIMVGKSEGTNFTNSLLVGHTTTGTLNDAQDNTGVGIGALDTITSADSVTAIGKDAAQAVTSGGYSTVVGAGAYFTNSTGTNNTAIGRFSLRQSSGSNNVALGKDSGESLSSGSQNIIIGSNTGDQYPTTGSGNVLIGNNIDADASDSARTLKIAGYDGTTTTTWIKGASTGAITFNSAYTFPTADGSNGQVLQTDGAGNITFAESSGGGGGNNTAVKQFNHYKLDTTSAVVDEFDTTEYRGAIYDVTMEDQDNGFVGHLKVSVVHDGSTPYVSVYNVNEDSTRIADFTVAISGDMVQLSAATNTSSHTNLRIYRVALGDHHETVANTNSKIIATSTNIGSAATTLDQFTKTDIRGAKYVILIKDDTAGDYQISEMSLTHDGSTVYHDQYAVSSSRSTPLHSFSAAISGETVTLSALSGGNTTGTAILYRQDLGSKTKLGDFDNFFYGIKGDIDSAVETVDTFDAFKYKSARYFVTMESGSEYQNSEVTMTVNNAGSGATVSESFVITANNTLATFTADVSSGKARLRASCNPNTKIYFARLAMEADNIYRASGQTADDLYITHNNLKLEPGAITLPTGATSDRPSSSKVGMLRYNTSTGSYERYDTAGWVNIAKQASVSESNDVSTGEQTSISASATNIDTFTTATFDSAFYLAVTKDEINDEVSTAQISLVHDNSSAMVSAGGGVQSGDNAQLTYTADINSGTVRLRGTGTAAVNSIKFYKIGLGDNTSASSAGNVATIINTDVDSAVENLDTWAHASYRGAKYYISMNNSTNGEVGNIECLVTHNGSDAFITNYNDVFTGSNSLTADISGDNVRLRASCSPNTAVKMYRVLLSDAESDASSTNTKTVGQTTTSSSASSMDSFVTDSANGVHYIVVGNSSSESASSISEVFVTTDGTDAYISTGPSVSTKGSDQLTFTAALSGTTVTVSSASTSGASTTVNAYRVNMLRASAGAATSEQVLVSTTQTITGAKTLSNTVVKMTNLPTSDPSVAGQLWNSSGTLKISAG
jgi:hypothetical protein